MSLFEATLGFALCGVFISLFMFGVVTVQTFTYYRTFVNDKPALKILIALIWLLELGIAICISMGIYMMLVTNFGNILRLSQIPTSMITALILGGISCHLAQALFIYRIYVLSGKKIVFPIVFGGLSLFLLTIVFLSTAKAFTTVAVQPHSTEGEGFLSTLFIGSVIEDLSIAVFMCYFLRKQKKASLTSTGALLDRLFVFTVQSCIITSMIAVCGAICFFTMPNNYAWTMPMILIHSSFSNLILSSWVSKLL
ncbi:hypothetical protein BDQ12DRAFT_725958 [Crucibulum laeve]|uniref:DUF6534 domain-containing protein n=1 Tax=Crucibulum laeve TaxID=68775 RepID=A0A5C3LS61_9AGAR|nr:hypothetical protein BDQ12DRAFT_725958 [Crucibulum laeve]